MKNTNNIHTVDILSDYTEGKFRMIVKTKLGMTCCDANHFDNSHIMKYPEAAITNYRKGVLQTVQFQPKGSDYWLTVFSRTGKTVRLIDKSILVNLTVGTINSLYYNTNLYSQTQYNAVNAKTWASYAYQMNESQTQLA